MIRQITLTSLSTTTRTVFNKRRLQANIVTRRIAASSAVFTCTKRTPVVTAVAATGLFTSADIVCHNLFSHHQNNNQNAPSLFGSAITTRTASVVNTTFCSENKKEEPSGDKNQQNSSVTATADNSLELKPMLEATIRAMRLIKTVVCIVMDYKLESYKEPIDRVLVAWGMTPRHRRLSIGHDGDDDEYYNYHDQLLFLEKQIQEKSLALQQAQREYSEKRAIGKESNNSSSGTKEEKREQVYIAAQELAKAEMNLSNFLVSRQDGRNECSENDDNAKDDKNDDCILTVHERAARRILDLCRTNGGTYIKVGQHLANLDHLLPEAYIKTLQSLFGDAPVTEYEHVREVIKEELGKYPEQLFQEFQEVPIASASLAQVHVARDFKGQKLAIKVQHRGLRETSKGDLLALEYVVRLVDGLFEDFKWGWVCDEIAPNLPKELDFVNEGKNAQAAADHFRKNGLNCVVPKVHWDQTTSRVLVMDFEEGFSCTNVEMMEATGVNKRDLAMLISSVFQSQVFQTGFVHCDPHAENVYWRVRNGKPQVVLFDHGLYKQIDDNFRLTYAQLWKSLLLADVEGIKTSCSKLGVNEMYPLLAAMLTTRPFDEVIERNRTKSFTAKRNAAMDPASDTAMIRGYAQQYLKDIIQMLDKVPRQMLLLFKMNDCLRHIDYALGSSPTNTIVVAGKYAAQTVYDLERSKAKTTGRKVQNWISHVFLLTRIRLFQLASR